MILELNSDVSEVLSLLLWKEEVIVVVMIGSVDKECHK